MADSLIMANKVFKSFDDSPREESVIGGTDHDRVPITPELVGTVRLVVPSLPETVRGFRKAARDRELVVEVGSGRGRFLNTLARARPDRLFLGIDVRLGFCMQTLRRADRADISNLWAAWGDARALIPVLIEPGKAVEAYLLFPDPWWKRRHARRRHGVVMAGRIADALAPGGLLVLKSDVPEYLGIMVESFMGTGRYEAGATPPDLPPTDREVRIVTSGGNCFTATLHRR